jgi:hypothetical protein
MRMSKELIPTATPKILLLLSSSSAAAAAHGEDKS